MVGEDLALAKASLNKNETSPDAGAVADDGWDETPTQSPRSSNPLGIDQHVIARAAKRMQNTQINSSANALVVPKQPKAKVDEPVKPVSELDKILAKQKQKSESGGQ